MFRFEKSIVISKTPHDVFEFVANPANIPAWRFDVGAVKFGTLPIKRDDIIQEVDPRDTTVSLVRVIDVVDDERLLFEVLRGGMYLPRREIIFSSEKGHTVVTAKISAKSDGFSRWMEPDSSADYSLKWENYLFSLKRVLEAGDDREVAQG